MIRDIFFNLLPLVRSGVIPVLDTGIQFLLHCHLMYSFAIKLSGSQCLGTGMTEEETGMTEEETGMTEEETGMTEEETGMTEEETGMTEGETGMTEGI